MVSKIIRHIREEVKNVILEGNFDKLTTHWGKDLFTAIKKNKRNWNNSITISRYSKNMEEDEDHLIDIEADIKYNKKLKYAYSIEGVKESETRDTEDHLILLHIEINPMFYPMAFSDLSAEIKDAIRHELEHVSQEIKDERKIDTKRYLSGIEKPYARYLLSNAEIPAYVVGFYKKAKITKKPLDDVMLIFLNRVMKDKLIDSGELNNVFKTWITYAKKHLPKAQYSQKGIN